MGTVNLKTASGGSVILSPANTASDVTITVPAANATMATLTTPSFATTIGVGGATPSASGSGITFPSTQSPSTDANTLDDYEEGTWTPTLVGTNLTGLSIGYGYYTKVGRLVTLTASVNCTVTSSNTLTYITTSAAPFTPSVSTTGSAFLNNNIKSGTSQIASNNSAVYTFFPAASAPVAGAEIIQFSITYIV